MKVSHLTTREQIIKFFISHTKNILNKNCNEPQFYSRRGCGHIYNLIKNYFDDADLCASDVTRIYYHIFYKDEPIRDKDLFINFREGYKGRRKPKPPVMYVNETNVNRIRLKEIYTIDETISKLNENKICEKNNRMCSFTSKLVKSLYEHTNIKDFKYEIPYRCRLKIIHGKLDKNELCYCVICKNAKDPEKSTTKTCSPECQSIHRSQIAKVSNDLSGCRSRESIDKAAKARSWYKHSDETKAKIGKSNSVKWNDESFRKKMEEVTIKYNVRERQSQTMKDMILRGEFTPKSENRKRAKRVFSDITNINYRSTWELKFHEENLNLIYENKRIPYFDTTQNDWRVYIVDFEDAQNKILFEIKPTSELGEQNYKDKCKYTEEWCRENGYQFKVITEKDYDFRNI